MIWRDAAAGAGRIRTGSLQRPFGYQREQAIASAAVPEKVTNNVRHRTATKARLGDCLGKTVKFRSGLSSGPPKRKHP